MADSGQKAQTVLDECRMLILGGQVLIGFAAQSVLEPGFRELSAAGRAASVVGMLSMIFAVALLMWPAAYHRITCAGQDWTQLQCFATRALLWALAPISIGLAVALYVCGERVSGALAGATVAAAVLISANSAWYIYPLSVRRRAAPQTRGGEGSMSSDRDLGQKIHHVLTEARMILPGAQALLGFGTIAVLMDRFREFPPPLRIVHIVGLLFIALTIVLLMTPAAYHRLVERGENTERLHRVATRFLLAAMATLAPGIAAGAWVVVEIAFGNAVVGAVTGGFVVAAFYALWFGWTWAQRSSSRRAPGEIVAKTARRSRRAHA